LSTALIAFIAIHLDICRKYKQYHNNYRKNFPHAIPGSFEKTSLRSDITDKKVAIIPLFQFI